MSLVFVVNVWRDGHLADRLISQLKEHYPEATRLVIPDEPRLKHILTGEWTQRFLERALATAADPIIKMDPDTCVWRRAKIPVADYFGEINYDRSFVLGGACGFSRAAATRLVESKLLLRESPFSYERYSRYRWPHEYRDDTPISSQDLTVGLAMAQLKITPTQWKDVRILGNQGKSPEPGRRAITHPHPCVI